MAGSKIVSRAAVAAALLAVFAGLTGFGESAPSKNREGNKLYKQSKYDEALERYRAAQVIAPDLPELAFNAGDALLKKGDVDDALREFGKAAAAPDSMLSANAHYNAGNAFLGAGQAEQAIAAYTEALKRNPNDEDAKYNLELALRLLEEQKQQQEQNQQQNQQQNQNQQGNEQQNQQNQQNQEKNQQQNEQQRQGQEEQQAQQDQQQQEQQAQTEQAAGMSKEDAERLLDAVGEQEQEVQEQVHEAQARKRTRVDKDW